jgi:hypothetical protein
MGKEGVCVKVHVETDQPLIKIRSRLVIQAPDTWAGYKLGHLFMVICCGGPSLSVDMHLLLHHLDRHDGFKASISSCESLMSW